jgi:hypothetical protein
MYETPTIAGFSLQTAFAEDNYWDVALRYAGEHHGFRVAFGIGYQEDTKFNSPLLANSLVTGDGIVCTTDCNRKDTEVKGSASILHVPTGLFLTGAAGHREVDNKTSAVTVANQNFDVDFWYLAGGVRKNFFGFGDTVLFGEYSEHNDFVKFSFSDTGSKVTSWGLGVNQYIDAAAMEVFATYKHFEADASSFAAAGLTPKDLDVVVAGMRVNF